MTGYAVALPGDTSSDGNPVWYGGGKLAADLTWPKLRHRWHHPAARPTGERLTAAERHAIWEHVTQTAADAAAQIRAMAGTDPAAAADAAWAASGTLHAAAAALGSRILGQAADAYDRAARPAHGRIPAPTPAGNQLRHAARLIGAFAHLTNDPALAPLALVSRLAALAEAVAGLRQAQQYAAQAAAARVAAERLRNARRAAAAASLRPGPRRAMAADLAAQAFPVSPYSRQPRPGQPAGTGVPTRLARRPASRRPSGPAR